MRKKIVVVVLVVVPLVASSVLLLDSDVLWIRSERVQIEGDGVTLDAELAFPRWKDGPYPAAVIIHGSGRTTARELHGYARLLVPYGMAVLMYDKRGVGGSTGVYQEIGVPNSEVLLGRLADDATAAVRYLGVRYDIDPERIGLIGASQAGWIMPLAASRSDRVRFIVSISGPAVTYGQEMYYSQLTGDDPGPYTNLSDAEIERRFAEFIGPHGYDPIAALESLRVPSLWILGERDRSVPTSASVANLERLERDRPGRFTIRVFPECDHNIRDAGTGRRIDIWPGVRKWLQERKFLPR